MPSPTAVLDTDVLVPIVACDFLLTAFDHGLYEPIISTAALDEIERTLGEDFPHLDPAAIRHRVATMQVALEDQLVDGQAVDVPAGINSSPNDVHAVIDTMVSKRQRPPISTEELIGALHRYMPSLAVAVQAS